MATYGVDEAKNRVDLFPVGYIYMSVVNTDPGELFDGVWERIKDRFLLAAGDTYAAGNVGGEASHTLTVDEIPAHNHVVDDTPANPTVAFQNDTGSGSSSAAMTNFEGSNTGNAGGGQAHNNMPPYLTVYMWKRVS